MLSNRLRIVVLGYIVRYPLGGMAWHHLQYVLGLHRLGHDVYFMEDSDEYESCYDPTTYSVQADPSYGLRFTADTFARLGLENRWAYFDAHSDQWLGPSAGRVAEIFATSELLLNVSGVNPIRPWAGQVPRRVLIDTDPAFTQIRHLSDPDAHRRALLHTGFFSFGENIGKEDCAIPQDGLDWQPTRQPVVLDAWPVTDGPGDGRFTTVLHWDSYPPREYAGQHYGMKSLSFAPYLDLPQRVPADLELALGGTTAPRELLRANGWLLRDPQEPTRDPWSYQAYIRNSTAEFTVAKHGYVISRSGWFSERSAAYLASGRPVITQDTGFTDALAAGSGLLAFSTPDEARAAIDRVVGDYSEQCRAARDVAETYFDARQVLSRLVEQSMASHG